jgi:hypothetical protein
MGRTNIDVVAKTITSKYGGELVYGDTGENQLVFLFFILIFTNMLYLSHYRFKLHTFSTFENS